MFCFCQHALTRPGDKSLAAMVIRDGMGLSEGLEYPKPHFGPASQGAVEAIGDVNALSCPAVTRGASATARQTSCRMNPEAQQSVVS
jgi:hypothetical protein